MLPIAGPGQSPASHQPIPKIADPKIRFLSRIHDFFHEKCQISEKNGLSCLERKKCQKRDIINAPNITNNSVGSQEPKISKNHCTRSGEIISDRASPNQNNNQAVSVIIGGIVCFIEL